MNYSFTGKKGTALFTLLALLLTFTSAAFNTSVSAQSRKSAPTVRISEESATNLTVEKVTPLDMYLQRESAIPFVIDPNSIYSNVTTFLGIGTRNTTATLVGANTFTALVADDLTHIRDVPVNVTAYKFTVANFNATAVSARPLVRFYANDGAGGGPGTLLGGNNFNAISFAAGNVIILNTGPLATPITLTTQTVWAGITFDNNSGATGATATQLDNLGQGNYNPPDRGTSADLAFRTTTGGSFAASNPAGATFNSASVDNFGWELVITPTAASVSIGGRVTTADGVGISKANVSITGADGISRQTLTSPFGYYRFDDVGAGQTYVVTVAMKRYEFPQQQQVIFAEESTDDVNFTAAP
jgi:hypothetical protein